MRGYSWRRGRLEKQVHKEGRRAFPAQVNGMATHRTKKASSNVTGRSGQLQYRCEDRITGNWCVHLKSFISFSPKVIWPARAVSNSRFLNPFVVAFVVIAGVAIVAIAIGLLIHFLAFDRKACFYRSSFQILNVEYTDELSSPATQEYRTLSEQIESMITNVFKESNLRKQFIRAHVVKLRQSGSGVTADVVMKFRFSKRNDGNSMKGRVQAILQKMLNNSGGLEIHSSPGITTITSQDTENIFTQACGARPDLLTLSEERIIGGTLAEDGDWPWQVSLHVNNVHHCGGILISNTWILTAAHCFRSYSNPQQWTATFGASTIFPKRRARIRTIVVHNNYRSGTQENDIAVVQLNTAITFTKDIHSVCLPEPTMNTVPGSTAYVTGWGALTYGGFTVSDLRQGQVRIISNTVCNAPTAYNGAVLSGMLCAGVPTGGVDACQGDSGGPLVQEDSRRLWFVVGIVSWGYQCGLPDKPGVYTRVATYRNWIREQTRV
ncbi:PREDICTED: transmembrane protease serine 11D [Dipodomys ordii]|uniref:Transmembrane protease serine 11D n=1 Tax=Dipodomys ordii TaxID=10020 RepID=A0A1S3EJ17_DIPOR|nr:PREDICTED: transmembrane protease serine 11D [Dipodomys ordii]